jgi:hypothetical protein
VKNEEREEEYKDIERNKSLTVPKQTRKKS